MDLKQSSEPELLEITKRTRVVLPLKEKVKILDLIREKKSYAEVAKIYGKNESSIREIAKKEKEIRASYAICPVTAKVMTTARDKCLVEVEKVLLQWIDEMHKNGEGIDSQLVRKKALMLYKDFSKQFPGSTDKPFTGSKGWLYRFKNRFGLRRREGATTSEPTEVPQQKWQTMPDIFYMDTNSNEPFQDELTVINLE